MLSLQRQMMRTSHYPLNTTMQSPLYTPIIPPLADGRCMDRGCRTLLCYSALFHWTTLVVVVCNFNWVLDGKCFDFSRTVFISWFLLNCDSKENSHNRVENIHSFERKVSRRFGKHFSLGDAGEHVVDACNKILAYLNWIYLLVITSADNLNVLLKQIRI